MVPIGMGIAGFKFALALIDLAPRAIAAGAQLAEAWNTGKAALDRMQNEKRDPTEAEWKVLHTLEESLGATIDARAEEAKTRGKKV
jgi:hypothetical protein